MSLTARILEQHGIPTVILGSARDIVEHCVVPRFLFVDFPLGNPVGTPYDGEMQREVVRQAFHMLSHVNVPRVTMTTRFSWPSGQSWRERYMEIKPEDREQLRIMGEERRNLRRSRK